MTEYTGTAYCVKCKVKREFTGEIIEIPMKKTEGTRRTAQGTCPVCDTKLFRFLPKA